MGAHVQGWVTSLGEMARPTLLIMSFNRKQGDKGQMMAKGDRLGLSCVPSLYKSLSLSMGMPV